MISFTNTFWNTLVHSTTMLTSVYENLKVVTVKFLLSIII